MIRPQNYDKHLFIILAIFSLCCCKQTNLKSIPTFDKDGYLNAIVEIPAGTNQKIEYNAERKTFDVDQRNGADRIIPFLPYPGNYGFIPSTLSDSNKGGDGDPVDIIVIAPTQRTGTQMAVIPLTMLKLIDNNEEDFKIIAVPVDQKLNVLGIRTFAELQTKHPAVLQIIETWFLNYDTEPAKSIGWANQKETNAYIQANLDNKK